MIKSKDDIEPHVLQLSMFFSLFISMFIICDGDRGLQTCADSKVLNFLTKSNDGTGFSVNTVSMFYHENMKRKTE